MQAIEEVVAKAQQFIVSDSVCTCTSVEARAAYWGGYTLVAAGAEGALLLARAFAHLGIIGVAVFFEAEGLALGRGGFLVRRVA